MFSAKFELEVITPLMTSSGKTIDGSPYPKNTIRGRIILKKKIKTSEIRVPSIKGVIRWWFRAITPHNDIKELKKIEEGIFGSTEKASKIRMRIEYENLLTGNWSNKDRKKYESFVKNKRYSINGFYYLSFTNFVESTKKGETDVRQFIAPRSKFNLIISSLDKNAFENAVISFWFALNFGGFGNRARRGFGDLKVRKVEINPKPANGEILNSFSFNPDNTLESYNEMIKNGIEGWKKYFEKKGCGSTNKYTNILDAKFYLIDKENLNENIITEYPLDSWEKALDDAGKRFQYFRQEYPNDKQEILKLNERRMWIGNLKKPVFGLPIRYRFNKKRFFPVIEHKKKGDMGDHFASPVWISIHKIGENYYPAFLFMFSNPAQGMDITVNGLNGKFAQNSNVFDEFITEQLKSITPIEFKP
ncbi:MAG: type III-B CRISPR module RAMP protein Cmr1 [Candidatus Altiarchaeales archaeon WOR_SM1_79]|nr:MAG: type III-B CRISPR module RAMP protein Cmr1 [Candidatus Altiarchaeales archaeon WOR_SM1_79]